MSRPAWRRRGGASAVAAVLACGLLAAGCFEGRRTIRVNADGSGTIVDDMVLGEQMKAMMAMADAKGEDAKAKEKAKFEAAAAAMGPGVTFVGEEKTAQGFKATYAFKDISKLKLDISPGPDENKDSGESKEQPLTFRFARQGGKSVLTVVQPEPPAKKAEVAGEVTEGAAEATEAEGAAAMAQGMEQMGMAMWGMMKPMMKGLKLRTVVEVNGTLAKTNSPHAQGSTVTLLDMDFDQIAADEANFKKFTAAGDDPGTMNPKLLQGVKGIKVNPDTEVVIEFSGK